MKDDHEVARSIRGIRLNTTAFEKLMMRQGEVEWSPYQPISHRSQARHSGAHNSPSDAGAKRSVGSMCPCSYCSCSLVRHAEGIKAIRCEGTSCQRRTPIHICLCPPPFTTPPLRCSRSVRATHEKGRIKGARWLEKKMVALSQISS